MKEYEENEQDRNNDIGILVLDIPLGAKTGSLGLTNSIDNFNYKNGTIIGYPALDSGIIKMYKDSKPILSDDGHLLEYEIDTIGGSSGSAVFDSEFRVIGIHVAGDLLNKRNIAVKLNEKNLSFINSIVNKNKLEKWVKLDNIWYYYEDGVKQVGWHRIDSKWYFFDKIGQMQIGWQKIDEKW